MLCGEASLGGSQFANRDQQQNSDHNSAKNLRAQVPPKSHPRGNQNHGEQHGQRAAHEIHDQSSAPEIFVARQNLAVERGEHAEAHNQRKPWQILHQSRGMIKLDRHPPAGGQQNGGEQKVRDQ